MKYFHCDNCGMMVFFENDLCLKCGHPLGFLPDQLDLSALEKSGHQWRASSSPSEKRVYRNCANGQEYKMWPLKNVVLTV